MMNLPIGDIVFWGIAILTIASAMVVAFSKKITHAAFSLMFSLFGVAGLFVFLGADFLAGVQVMIYVGGILVLLLFGILMTQTIAQIQMVDQPCEVVDVRRKSVGIVPRFVRKPTADMVGGDDAVAIGQSGNQRSVVE